MKRFMPVFLAAAAVLLPAGEEKLTEEQRIEITRGLTAEYATMKIVLPRAKKPLAYPSSGAWDKKEWAAAAREFGPAARVGDLIQITKISFDNDKIQLEINGGPKGGRKWYDRVQVGVGSRTAPISSGGSTAPAGANIALLFGKRVPPIETDDIKKMLSPIMDFEKHSATELYVENLPPPIQAAIKEKRATEGMDRDQVMLALGRPRTKVRETKDGVEYEDWIYGEPPGKITFVTFSGSKVVRVRDAYAGLGGSVAPPLEPR